MWRPDTTWTVLCADQHYKEMFENGLVNYMAVNNSYIPHNITQIHAGAAKWRDVPLKIYLYIVHRYEQC